MTELTLSRTVQPASGDGRERTGLSLRDRVEADLRARLPLDPPPVGTGASALHRYAAVDGRPVPRPGAAPLKRRASPVVGTAGELVYAVGDVHGRYDLLLDLLAKVAEDAARAAAGRPPLLIFCGDYIDRGPKSAEVLEALVWLQRAGWRLCLLKGNHEQGLLQFLDEPARGGVWLRYGGDATLSAYGVAPPEHDDVEGLWRARDELLAAMPASHLRLLQELDLMAVVGGYLFVHAGLAPGTALHGQREADLLWIRGEFIEAGPVCDRVVVHGHTWTDAEPQVEAHRIGVDTGAYATGVLSAVRLDGLERKVIQALDSDAAARRRPQPSSLIRAPADFTRGALPMNLSFNSPRTG